MTKEEAMRGGVPEEACISLDDEENANWRDNLRKNPDDPRYKGPDLTKVLTSLPEPGYPEPGAMC
jgi:hypothetical protein